MYGKSYVLLQNPLFAKFDIPTEHRTLTTLWQYHSYCIYTVHFRCGLRL